MLDISQYQRDCGLILNCYFGIRYSDAHVPACQVCDYRRVRYTAVSWVGIGPRRVLLPVSVPTRYIAELSPSRRCSRWRPAECWSSRRPFQCPCPRWCHTSPGSRSAGDDWAGETPRLLCPLFSSLVHFSDARTHSDAGCVGHAAAVAVSLTWVAHSQITWGQQKKTVC